MGAFDSSNEVGD